MQAGRWSCLVEDSRPVTYLNWPRGRSVRRVRTAGHYRSGRFHSQFFGAIAGLSVGSSAPRLLWYKSTYTM